MIDPRDFSRTAYEVADKLFQPASKEWQTRFLNPYRVIDMCRKRHADGESDTGYFHQTVIEFMSTCIVMVEYGYD